VTELGVFAKVFGPGPPTYISTAIRNAGFTVTQLNLSAFGRPTLDDRLTDGQASGIAATFAHAGVRIWGLSGSFNTIDPDQIRRRASIKACLALIDRAPALGAEVVTICTGTRDPDDMWRGHPGNRSPEAWRDLRATLEELLVGAANAGIRLAIEPEPGNVVADAMLARRLLDELAIDGRQLAIVLDPANLLTVETLPQQRKILSRAFDDLGPSVAVVHAKDVSASGYAAPGTGGMDYDLVMRLHAGLPQPVPLIAQDLGPDDAARVHAFLVAHSRP
jgi:sugar phosphate isomerase/epimerase